MADEPSKQAAISSDGGFSQDPLAPFKTDFSETASDLISAGPEAIPSLDIPKLVSPSVEEYRTDEGVFIGGPREEAQEIKTAIEMDPYLSRNSDLDSTLGYMVTGRSDLSTKAEIQEETDPSFWEAIGTIFEPFLMPQRALWYGVEYGGQFLPDPGTTAGDALQSMAGEVGSMVLGSLIGAQTAAIPGGDPLDELLSDKEKFHDPESGKVYEDGSDNVGEIAGREFYNMATRLYDALATGELAEQAENNIRPWLWLDATEAPAPTGEAILDAMLPYDTAVQLAQTSDNASVREFSKWMSNDTVRMMYGLGLEVLIDPLWLWGPAGKTANVMSRGGKVFILDREITRMSGIMGSLDAGKLGGTIAYRNVALDLLQGSADETAEATKIVETFMTIGDQAAAHSAATANKIDAAIKSGDDLNAVAKSVMREIVVHVEERASHFKTIAETAKDERIINRSLRTSRQLSAVAAKNEANLNKLIASGDATLVKDWLVAQSQRYARTSKSFKKDADYLRMVQTNISASKARGPSFFRHDLAREKGWLAWHIPFTRKTHYLAKTGPLAKTGAYVKSIGVVADFTKEYSYADLSREINAYAAKIMTKEEVFTAANLDATRALAHEDLFTVFGGDRRKIIAYNIQNLLGEVGLIPLRFLDGLAKAFGTRFMQPMTEALLLENTRRIGAGVPTLTIGQKSIRRIRRLRPEIWENYQESLTTLMRTYQGIEMKLRTDIVRLNGVVETVYNKRREISKSGKRVKVLQNRLRNTTNEKEISRIRAEIKKIQRWGSPDYKPIHVLNEAGNAIDTGIGKFAELSPDAILVAERFRAIVKKIADDPDINAAMPQVEQALIALAREARGDANLFLEFQAQLKGVEEMIGWLDLDKQIKVKKIDDAFRVRVAQIKSFKDTLENYVTEELLVKALEKIKTQLSDIPYDESVHAKYIQETLEELLGSRFAASAVMRHMAIAMGQSDGALAVRMLAERLTKDLPVFKGKAIPEATKKGKSINAALKVGLKKYIKDLSEEMKILRKALRVGLPDEGVPLQGFILHPKLKPSEFKKLIEHMENNSGSILRSLIPDKEWEDFQKWAVSGARAADDQPTVRSFRGEPTPSEVDLLSEGWVTSPIYGGGITETMLSPAWVGSIDAPTIQSVSLSEITGMKPSLENPALVPRNPKDMSPEIVFDPKTREVILDSASDLGQTESVMSQLPYETMVIFNAETGEQVARGTQFDRFSSGVSYTSGSSHDDLVDLSLTTHLLITHPHPPSLALGQPLGWRGAPLSGDDGYFAMGLNASIRATSQSGAVMQLTRPPMGWFGGMDQTSAGDMYLIYKHVFAEVESYSLRVLAGSETTNARHSVVFADTDGSVIYKAVHETTSADLIGSRLSFVSKMISDKYGISPDSAANLIDGVLLTFDRMGATPAFLSGDLASTLGPSRLVSAAKESRASKSGNVSVVESLAERTVASTDGLLDDLAGAGLTVEGKGSDKYDEMVLDIWGAILAAQDEAETLVVGAEMQHALQYGTTVTLSGKSHHVPPISSLNPNIPQDFQFIRYERIGESSVSGRTGTSRKVQPRVQAKETKVSARTAERGAPSGAQKVTETPVAKAEKIKDSANEALSQVKGKKTTTEGEIKSLNTKLTKLKKSAKAGDEVKAQRSELIKQIARLEDDLDEINQLLPQAELSYEKAVEVYADARDVEKAAQRGAKAKEDAAERAAAAAETLAKLAEAAAEKEKLISLITDPLLSDVPVHWKKALGYFRREQALGIVKKKTYSIRGPRKARAEEIRSRGRVEVTKLGAQHAESEVLRMREIAGDIGIEHLPQYGLEKHFAGIARADLETAAPEQPKKAPKKEKLSKDASPEEQAKIADRELHQDSTSAAGSRLALTPTELERQALMQERRDRGIAIQERKTAWYKDTKGKKYASFKGNLKEWRKELNDLFVERFGVRLDRPDPLSSEWFTANLMRGLTEDPKDPVWSLHHAWEHGMSPQHALDRFWPDITPGTGGISLRKLSDPPVRASHGVPSSGRLGRRHEFEDIYIERVKAAKGLPAERISPVVVPAEELSIGALVRESNGRLWTVSEIVDGKYTVMATDARPVQAVGLWEASARTPQTRPITSIEVDGVINIGDVIPLEWFEGIRRTKKVKKDPTYQGIVYRKWRKRAKRGGKGEATAARDRILQLKDAIKDERKKKTELNKLMKADQISKEQHTGGLAIIESAIEGHKLEIEKVSKVEAAEGILKWHQRGAPSIQIGQVKGGVRLPANRLKPEAGLRKFSPMEVKPIKPKTRRKTAVTREGRKLKQNIEPLLPELDKLREQNLSLLRESFEEYAPDIDWALVGPDPSAKISAALRPILDVLYKFNHNINYAQKSGALDNIMRAVVQARKEMQRLRGWEINPLVSMRSPGPLFGLAEPIAAEIPGAITDILGNVQRLSSAAEYGIHFDLGAAVYRMIMNQERGIQHLDNIISQLSAVRRGEKSYIDTPILHDEAHKVYARRRGKRKSKGKKTASSWRGLDPAEQPTPEQIERYAAELVAGKLRMGDEETLRFYQKNSGAIEEALDGLSKKVGPSETRRRAAELSTRQELLRPERMTQKRYREALDGMSEEDIGKALQDLFTDGQHTDAMLDSVFAELGKRIAKRPIFKKYPHMKKLDSGRIDSALADVRAKIDEFFQAQEISPKGVARSGPAIRMLEKGSKLAKQTLTDEAGKTTEAFETLKKLWQEEVAEVQPKLPGRTMDDFDDPEALLDWEVALWTDINKIKAESNISEEEFFLAAFSLLREAPEVPSAEMRASLGKMYPQLMGRRLGDIDATLTPVVNEIARIIATYETEYATRGFGFMMDPVTMMKRHGVVGFVPHLNKTQDELQLGTRALIHKQREGGGTGLDQVLAMGFDATKKRQRFGSLQELNALISTVEAHGSNYLTLDPQVVWARYSQANKAMTNEDFVFDLIYGKVIDELHPNNTALNTKLGIEWIDASGRQKTVEEIAREIDWVPLFERQPDVSGRHHTLTLLLDGTYADWERAGILSEDIKNILLKGHVNEGDSFATWINHGPLMKRLRQIEDAVIRRRQWDLESKHQLFNPAEEFANRIDEPIESALKEWDEKVATELRAIGQDEPQIAMARAQTQKELLKAESTRLWETIAEEMNAVAIEAGFSAERGIVRIDGKHLQGYYGGTAPQHRLYVPRVVTQSIRDTLSFTPTPGVTKAAFDAMNNWWKTRVTVTALAFSARNALSNQMMQFLDLGPVGALNPWTQVQSGVLAQAVPIYEHYGSMREAWAFLSKPLKDEDIIVPAYLSAVSGAYKKAAKAAHLTKRQGFRATFGRFLKKGFELERGVYSDIDDVIGEMLRRGVVSPAYTAMVDINALERNLSRSLLTGGALGDGVQAQKMMKVAGALEDMVIVALPFTVSGGSVVAVPKAFGAKHVARTVENQARVMNFIANYRISKDWSSATNHVEKFLFNYGDLTKFQKNWMRTIVPFFTWNQKNVLLQMELMQTSPQLYSTFHRLMIDGLPQVIESTQTKEGHRYAPTDPLAMSELRKHEIQYLHTVKMPFPSLENTWLGNMPVPAKDMYNEKWRWGTLGKDYFPRMKHAQFKGLGLPQEAFVEKMSLMLGAVDHKNLPMFKGARAYESRQRWARFMSEIHFLGRFAVENAMNHNVFYDKPIHELTDGRLVASTIAGIRRTPIVGPVMANEMARMFGLSTFRVLNKETGLYEEFVKVDGNPNYVFSAFPHVRLLRSAAANTDILMTSTTVPPELYNAGWGDPAETRPIPLFWRGVDSLTGFNIVQSDPAMMKGYYYYRLDQVTKKQMEAVGAYQTFKKTYIDR